MLLLLEVCVNESHRMNASVQLHHSSRSRFVCFCLYASWITRSLTHSLTLSLFRGFPNTRQSPFICLYSLLQLVFNGFISLPICCLLSRAYIFGRLQRRRGEEGNLPTRSAQWFVVCESPSRHSSWLSYTFELRSDMQLMRWCLCYSKQPRP